MKFFNTVATVALSLLLIASLFILQFTFTLKKNIYNPSFYYDKFTTYKIYDKLEKNIDLNLSDAAYKYKFPSDLVNGLITNSWVKEQCITITEGMISYIKKSTDRLPQIDIKAPLTALNNNWANDVNSGKIIDNPSPDSEMAKAKANLYSKALDIPFSPNWNENSSENFKNNMLNLRSHMPYINYFFYGSIVISVLAIVFLFIVSEKLSSFKLWTGYSIIIGGLIGAVGGFFVANTTMPSSFVTSLFSVPKDALLSEKIVYPLATDLIAKLLLAMAKYGAVITMAGIGMILLLSLFDNERQRIFMYSHPFKSKRN